MMGGQNLTYKSKLFYNIHDTVLFGWIEINERQLGLTNLIDTFGRT